MNLDGNLNDFNQEVFIFPKIGFWTLVKDLEQINFNSMFGIIRNKILNFDLKT
jgi:hypothetical protein